MNAHVPERRCVGCGRVRPKHELLRLAGGEAGAIVVDPAARLGGRGAYVCRTAECARRACARGSLARALRRPGIDAGGLEGRILATFEVSR